MQKRLCGLVFDTYCLYSGVALNPRLPKSVSFAAASLPLGVPRRQLRYVGPRSGSREVSGSSSLCMMALESNAVGSPRSQIQAALLHCKGGAFDALVKECYRHAVPGGCGAGVARGPAQACVRRALLLLQVWGWESRTGVKNDSEVVSTICPGKRRTRDMWCGVGAQRAQRQKEIAEVVTGKKRGKNMRAESNNVLLLLRWRPSLSEECVNQQKNVGGNVRREMQLRSMYSSLGLAA